MAKPETNNKRRPWIGLVVATLLGILATIGVGWYQLSKTEAQTALAEQERTLAVRTSLVSILEEHVLNDKPISLPRLARLIDQRRSAQQIVSPISLSDVIEEAEYNILKSAYLPFERKESLKSVFDALYDELGSREFIPYSQEAPNADLVNELAGQIQEGKSAEALSTLTRLQEAHEKLLAKKSAQDSQVGLDDFIRQVFSEPLLPLVVMVVYAALLAILFPRYRRTLARLVVSRRDY